jgi:hypothetical protein
VAEETVAWAGALGLAGDERLRKRLERTDCARLGAAVYHDDYGYEALRLATDFMTWLYMHDDLWVDGVQRDPDELDADHARVLAVLRGAELAGGDHPLVVALDDVRQRLQRYAPSPELLEPFADSVEQYLSAKFWESRNHLAKLTPDLRLYVQMRSHGGGVVACFEMGVLVRPIRLTRHLRNHAHVQAMSHLANHLVCWANDIASLGKELEEGTTTNLVMALHEQYGLDWPAAMERAAAMWNDAMGAFARLAEQLGDIPFSDEERDQLEKYLILLASWVRGNLDYDLVVQRFDAGEAITPPASEASDAPRPRSRTP